MKKAILHLTAWHNCLKTFKISSRSIIFISLSVSLINPLQAETLHSRLQETEGMVKIASTERYLDNPNISRADKIQTFWKEYTTSSDPATKELAFEGLSFLSPTNLIPDFIDRFMVDTKHQEDYLELIIAGMEVKPKQLNSEDIQKIILAQNFLKQQIQAQDDSDLLNTVIYAYNNHTPYSSEKAKLINNALNRLAKIEKVAPQSLFRNKFDLDINDISGNSLNQLIGDIENSKYKGEFTTLIVSEIGTGLNAKMLSQPNQNEISGYLLKQIQQNITSFDELNDSSADSDDFRIITQSRQASNIYYQIQAYGNFLNNSSYLANAILSIQNPYLQAKLISAALSDSNAVSTHKILKAHKQDLILHLKKGIQPTDIAPPVALSISSDSQHVSAQDKLKLEKWLLLTKEYNERSTNKQSSCSTLIKIVINKLNNMQ